MMNVGEGEIGVEVTHQARKEDTDGITRRRITIGSIVAHDLGHQRSAEGTGMTANIDMKRIEGMSIAIKMTVGIIVAEKLHLYS